MRKSVLSFFEPEDEEEDESEENEDGIDEHQRDSDFPDFEDSVGNCNSKESFELH